MLTALLSNRRWQYGAMWSSHRSAWMGGQPSGMLPQLAV